MFLPMFGQVLDKDGVKPLGGFAEQDWLPTPAPPLVSSEKPAALIEVYPRMPGQAPEKDRVMPSEGVATRDRTAIPACPSCPLKKRSWRTGLR